MEVSHDGLSMWAAMNSETNSSTRMELAGATMAVQQRAAAHIASDSWAMVQKPNRLRDIVAKTYQEASDAHLPPRGQGLLKTLALQKQHFGYTDICPEAQDLLDDIAAHPHITHEQLKQQALEQLMSPLPTNNPIGKPWLLQTDGDL